MAANFKRLANKMRSTTVAIFLFFTTGAAFPQLNPAALPLHDTHEGFIVACDPYQDAARAKQLLGKKNPLEAGILPIEVYFQNSNNRAVEVHLESIRLEVVPPDQPSQRLEPLALEDVVSRTLHEQPNPNLAWPRRRLPHPAPSFRRSRKWRELEDRLRPLSLEVGGVPPSATVHGLLFFDLDGHFELLRYARLYVPDLEFVGANKPLMFFQVNLGGQRSSSGP